MTNVELAGPDLVEEDDSGPAPSQRHAGRGTVVTLTTVVVLLIAATLTALGLGAADKAVETFDSSSWLWSSTRGEVDRVNGVTARVDTRAKIMDAQNHEIEITQNDRYLILRDLETGEVTALDLTTLQVSAVMPTTPGRGVSVALYGDLAIIVDGVQGVVRQLHPRTLTPTGEALTLRRGIISGGFDSTGTLWVALPTDGTVVAIKPGADGAGPQIARTVAVTDPGHDLVLSALDSGVAVLDNTTQRLFVVDDGVQSVALPTRRPGVLPPRTTGRPIAVTIPTERVVLLVDGQNVTRVSVPGTGAIGPAVAYAGRVYVPDAVTGAVRVVTPAGQVTNTIAVPTPTGKVELEVREGYLFINSPDGPDARVVDSEHRVREVNKYTDGVLGGDPPPPLNDPDPPAPPVTPPGAPQAITATGGDGMVIVTWRAARANGAPITAYVIEGFGDPITVGASQRQVEITGLTNGETYRFSVYAVNAMGNGPRGWSNPVVPTREVPDPPVSVTATERPDGSVDVTWPEAFGQGRPILQYLVMSTGGDGVTASVGAVTGTSINVAPGALTYGTQYVFTVIAVNDLNAGSVESPPSNTVIPYTVPAAPPNLAAQTSPTQRGAVDLSWLAPASNGRPITGYEVELEDGTITTVTGTTTTITGLPDGEVVVFKVRAVNLAGAGAESTVSARTQSAPTLTVTDGTSGYGSISLTVTPDGGGVTAQCRLEVAGAGSVTTDCAVTPLTITLDAGLYANTTYDWTVTITNAVGSTSVTSADSTVGPITTATLRGTSICGDMSYCPRGAVYYSVPQQIDAQALGRIPVGATFPALCRTQNGPVINNIWGGKPGGGNPDPLRNNYWVKTVYGGNDPAWFPWVWTQLDGGDNISLLPQC